MKNQLTQLKAERKQALEALSELNGKIRSLELEQQLPPLRAKYLGKFYQFSRDGAYGSYGYVKAIDDNLIFFDALYFSFDGKDAEIQLNTTISPSSLRHPISRATFVKAWNEMVSHFDIEKLIAGK